MQALIGAVAALAGIIAGIILGYWVRQLSAKNEKQAFEQNATQALDTERRSAEARESSLREQIETARREVAELRPKAEELAVSRQKLADEEAKYAQMKAELDSAFKSASIRGHDHTPASLTRQR